MSELIPLKIRLSDIKKEFDKYLIIVDPWIIDMALGTLVGNAIIQRDPVWTMIVSKSSGGKTTLIKPATQVPGVFFVDDLTEKTLLSGYKIKGKETSLLKVIGNGVLAFSDFTSILSKNPVCRGEILGQMKLIYDGEVNKRTGTGEVSWKGKIGFLGAATPDIYFHLEQGRSMGERFTYYWMDQPSDELIADKQNSVVLSSADIQTIMAPMYTDYCKGIREWADIHGIPPLKLTDEQRKKIKEASIFCVNGKATVHTNFKTGKVDQIPNKAGVGRDNKAFDTLLHTFQLMDCYENDDINHPLSDERIKLIQKCAYSSINRERRKILEILVSNGVAMTASQIGSCNGLGLDKEAIEMYLSPLHAVGIVRKQINGNRFLWVIDNPAIIEFIQSVSTTLDDTLPVVEDEEVSSVFEFTADKIKQELEGQNNIDQF